MIINLFSVFDPSSCFGLSLNWIIMLIIFSYIPIKYYLIERNLLRLWLWMYKNVRNIFKEISIPNHIALNFLSVTAFIYLAIRNLLGLFPFIFTRMAHPVITLGFGLVLWLSFFFIGFITNFSARCAHLVPSGRPLILSPFIVIIERVRSLIRPLTLSVRLAANIIAGHLIIGLLSRIRLINLFGLIGSLIIQRVLLILEFCVAIIQGFVFRILLILYALEYY